MSPSVILAHGTSLISVSAQERLKILGGLRRRWVTLCKELQEHTSGAMESNGAWLHAKQLEQQVRQARPWRQARCVSPRGLN